MTIDWTLLDSGFAIKAQNLINLCDAQGFTMVPYCGLRTLTEEAKLWRQSRQTKEISQKIQSLIALNAPYLAQIIINVGPQPDGPWKTDTIPGLSWHNWGQAIDLYWQLPDGSINWDGKAQGYQVLGELATANGLKWGGDFTDPDWDHVQLNQQEIPDLYSLKYVNDYFKEKSLT